ncbi:UNVERIFIED_CONTAM: hypothetical protein PYX00_009471 [Menopon gallinae]|uniref:CDP-diacylglycerol--inositol 3-phosphatidyltransferase n=1 Tax=Menopon gallinae TaxID=328185 RepID=A0AAW2HC44_9NEOP
MTSEGKNENIFLFIPNLIGYARIILAIISFFYMPTNYVVASWCYILSALLDAFDGHAARYFNQSTKFGAILDQLTDRCGTMCLLVTLSNFYPKYMFWFQMVMVIDIACHWIYLHSTILQGRASHKFVDLSENAIMRIYYTNRQVLFFMCATNELFFASLYLMYFTSGPFGIFRILCFVTAPFMLVKTFISLVQAYVACKNMAIIDMKEREMLRKEK